MPELIDYIYNIQEYTDNIKNALDKEKRKDNPCPEGVYSAYMYMIEEEIDLALSSYERSKK